MDIQKSLTKESFKEYSLVDVLKLFSFGNELRDSLEKTSKSHRGALIVFSEKARDIAEGGFNINSRFTSQKLAELSKMDGAIIVESKLKKILSANTILTPDTKIKSKETGAKHKAAERCAKQLGTIVVVVSEKSSIISVYYGNNKYVLNNLTELLYKTREAVENLEAQQIELESVLRRFDSLEVSSIVKIEDLAQIINKIILFLKDAEVALLYISELGKYGETLKTRYNLVTKGINEELEKIEKDYSDYFEMFHVIKFLKSIKTPTLEQSIQILKSYSMENNSKEIFNSKGYRILSKVIFEENSVEKLISSLKGLDGFLCADVDKIKELSILDEKKVQAVKDFLINKLGVF